MQFKHVYNEDSEFNSINIKKPLAGRSQISECCTDFNISEMKSCEKKKKKEKHERPSKIHSSISSFLL